MPRPAAGIVAASRQDRRAAGPSLRATYRRLRARPGVALYLKSLTVRGFKSFASTTTLHFEPGITAVVGPNGAGKSNVVDAIAWVMGEQGAKSLRGGKMEDVIFAGTSGRPPLGRAEVVLTVDNSDGALPIDYSEVTISRIMFRSGGSEYAINGSPCRLLDVQELLSDSGIGREMHVIVGQGQLDEVLRATPEERRGFIEEAAGVLKHRKRKEKALRKLDATEANLHRLSDLLTELRRSLKPLGRQAEVARRAVTIQADVRDARLRLLADDAHRLSTERERDNEQEQAVRAERELVDAQLERLRRELDADENALARESDVQRAADNVYFGLAAVAERLRGIRQLAVERVRQDPADEPVPTSGHDPDELEQQAREAAEVEHRLRRELSAHSAALGRAIADRQAAEEAYTAEDRRVADELRAAADRREGLARLAGQVQAVNERITRRARDVARLTEAADAAKLWAEAAAREFTALETRIAGLDAGEEDLDSAHETALARLTEVTDRLEGLAEQERVCEQRRVALTARLEALEQNLDRGDGGAALMDGQAADRGVLGTVASLLQVREGFEAAVSAALREAADAIAVDSLDSAVAAMRSLKSGDSGRAALVFGAAAPASESIGDLPPGARPLADMVEPTGDVGAAVVALLADVAVVDDGLDSARSVASARPDLTVVTLEGDLLSARLAVGGSSAAPSLVQVQAAVDQARTALDATEHDLQRLRFETAELSSEREAADGQVQQALGNLHTSDAEMAAIADQLAHLQSAARTAHTDADRAAAAVADAEQAQENDRARVSDLSRRLAAAEDQPDVEPGTQRRDELALAATAARAGEVDARLTLRAGEERGSALFGQADSLRQAAAAERAARDQAALVIAARRHAADVGRAVRSECDELQAGLSLHLAAAANARDRVAAERAQRKGRLTEQRLQVQAAADRQSQLTDTIHAADVLRAEQRLRLEQLAERAQDEHGLSLEVLMADYGPHVEIPVASLSEAGGPAQIETDDAGEDEAQTSIPFVRAEQEQRLRRAERELGQLGRVNPLALEEFRAMEERHAFLSDQLEDLRKTRTDLLSIIDEVDDRVQQVFAEAFADVEAQFETTFARLFPGGEGRLILTEPNDLLATGIEVEARPPGKKVKRLSLLSGGERSLVAVAFLVALFKARPNPFYILDEVEAALDDTNLGRLLEIYEELRQNSQLLVITHQKRTMEVADALYGVSMRGDGVSEVISQRLRAVPAPVPAR